jgi:hypothetical protein
LNVNTLDVSHMLLSLTTSALRNGSSRVRSNRLTQQRRVPGRAPSDELALERVDGFVDRIAALPVASWLEIGRLIICGTPSSAERSCARTALENVIAGHELSVAAWFVRDAVETSAFIASYGHLRRSTERHQFAAARRAAEESALVMLVQGRLNVASFETLTAPFHSLLSYRNAVFTDAPNPVRPSCGGVPP